MASLPQDPFRRERALWFLACNVLAVLISAGVFYAILRGEVLNAVFDPLMRGIYEHKLLVVGIAMSPLLASMLVGMAYAQRAIRRKRAAAASSPS